MADNSYSRINIFLAQCQGHIPGLRNIIRLASSRHTWLKHVLASALCRAAMTSVKHKYKQYMKMKNCSPFMSVDRLIDLQLCD